MKAQEMNALFDQCIADYHRFDQVTTPEKNPYDFGSLKHILYHKSWIDTVQWHLEDIIRNPEIDPEKALVIKRRIDASNQDRTDQVERIDDHFMSEFARVNTLADARLNTESPAWAIDRLSILALKIYHMNIEAHRQNIPKELHHKNHMKLNVLLTQRNDLSLAIDQLLEDLRAGRREMKVYRQMKMYNDPELNPVLYGTKKN